MEKQLKIFDFKKKREEKTSSCKTSKKTSDIKTSDIWTIYVDGAARNNPGPAGAGVYIQQNDTEFKKSGYYLGIKTNNQAEYLALAIAIFLVNQQKIQNPHLTIISDSELLVKQMKGLYKVKNPILKKIKILIDDLLKDTTQKFKHVLRSKNKIADNLANIGIDKKKKLPISFIKVLEKYGI